MSVPASQVFVLSAGRTATTTFARAAAHLPGFTAGHETRVTEPLATRLGYPRHHIEADNRLVFHLQQLEARYGDKAHYVHIRRDPAEIAQSYAARWPLTVSVVRAWTHGVRMRPRVRASEIEAMCRDYVDWAESTLALFFARQAHVMSFDLAAPVAEFTRFAHWAGVDEVPNAALAEWRQSHNANRAPGLRHHVTRQMRLWMA
ncbi:hypothetical protein ACXN5S_03670 [Pseudoroseicyclus sp. H15]